VRRWPTIPAAGLVIAIVAVAMGLALAAGLLGVPSSGGETTRSATPAPRPAVEQTTLFPQPRRGCRPPRGGWAGGHWPPACWRPYSKRSPFNRRLSSHPPLLAGWPGIVRRLSGLGPVHLSAGADLERWGPPTYWPRRRDPVFRVHCTKPWGRCEIEGRRVRIPDAARPASGSDGHMTVVDQRTRWEYDFWQVQRKPPGGGRLDISWGGRTRIGGNGLDSDGTAARFGNLAGAVRAEELAAGKIRHALFVTVPCDSGRWVYPARKGGTACSDVGESNVDAPPMGARFWLAMSEHEIDALPAPRWRKALLRAMARYGMYVGDTGGPTWAIEQEGSSTYTSLGYRDRWAELARRIGAPYDEGSRSWRVDVLAGVDWAARLRVVAPCAVRVSC
jgi:hypothetical protein